jgi:hypothetical protein
MNDIFTIQQVIEADPKDIQNTCTASQAIKDRISSYVAATSPTGALDRSGQYRF